MTSPGRFLIAIVVWAGTALAQSGQQSDRVTLLAVGDMNLGRTVGQKLLLDSLRYPFEHVGEILQSYDIVFGNLESQITDQGGETQHPTDRYIFCAPPQAARSMSDAGVTVVSTANNHAFDYAMKGLTETIAHLTEEGIAFTGTSLDSVELFPPAIIERKGVKVGFVAYTQFVNGKGEWNGCISQFDLNRAKKEIKVARTRADIVVASFHGGVEYVDQPNKTTLGQMRSLVDAGADIVIGHHPHVPQGIEVYKGKWIFYSLGNFVFYQPQREWTQRAFAAEITLVRGGNRVSVGSVRLLPLRASHQPSFQMDELEREGIFDRLRSLSSIKVSRKDDIFVADFEER